MASFDDTCPKCFTFKAKNTISSSPYLKKPHSALPNPYCFTHEFCYRASFIEVGGSFHKTGKYMESLECTAKSLEIRRRVLGEEHADTAMSYYCVGVAYYKQKDYAKSLEYLNTALMIQERIAKSESPEIATSYYSIGLVYSDLSENEKALEYYNKALEIREKIFPENDPNIKIVSDSIKALLDQQE